MCGDVQGIMAGHAKALAAVGSLQGCRIQLSDSIWLGVRVPSEEEALMEQLRCLKGGVRALESWARGLVQQVLGLQEAIQNELETTFAAEKVGIGLGIGVGLGPPSKQRRCNTNAPLTLALTLPNSTGRRSCSLRWRRR